MALSELFCLDHSLIHLIDTGITMLKYMVGIHSCINVPPLSILHNKCILL